MTNNNKNPEGNGHTFSQQKNEDPGRGPQRGMMNNNDGNIMNNNTPTTKGQHSHNETNTNNGNPRLHLKRNANFRRIRETFKRTIKHHADPFGNVINLSKHKFSIPEYKLLGKKLNFCSTAGKYNKKILTKETNEFFRRIKLRAHFGNNTNNRTTEENIFKPRSNWQPKQVHHTVNTFCEAISNEINKHVEKKTSHNNLTEKEIEVMHTLTTRTDLVITKADKGGAIVIMDVDDYVAEANRQLSDSKFYKKLTHNPTPVHAERINKAIEQFKEGLITENITKGLKSYEPQTSKFSLYPKIHKDGNPGRPVIISVDCHSSKISKYVDYHLQPEVCKLKSYTKDSTDAMNKLAEIKGEITEHDILVTMDVHSLYTNIPNDEGIQAVREKLNNSPSRIPTRVITTFLLLIVTLNNFIFNGVNYL